MARLRRMGGHGNTAASWPMQALGRLIATLAWIAAGALGAMLAVVLAATVLVLAFMSSVVLALAATGVKARRGLSGVRDDKLIEARQVGGHSWVAYGWDG